MSMPMATSFILIHYQFELIRNTNDLLKIEKDHHNLGKKAAEVRSANPAATHIVQATHAHAKTKAYPKSVAAPVHC